MIFGIIKNTRLVLYYQPYMAGLLFMTNKFHAQITEYGGRTYHSRGEARLAADLDVLKKSGIVTEVVPQKAFTLYGKNGFKICTHRVDFFVTFKDGHSECWEYKGYATNEWKIKANLFIDNYPDIPYFVYTKDDSYDYRRKPKRNR